MQNDSSNLEDLIMPSDDVVSAQEELGLTEKAIEVAEAQAEIRDVLSLTIGNIFAFFALLFPPVIANTLELTARVRGGKQKSDKNHS